MNRRQRRLTQKQGRSQQPQGFAPPLQQKFKLALHHHQAGRLAEAEPLYRQVLAAAPHHADSLQLLGVLSYQTGRAEAAVALIGQAIQIISDNPAYLNNLGTALQAQGKLDDAIGRFTEALRLKPDYPNALNNLGNALQAQGKLDDAIGRYTEALRLKPDHPDALNNLGTALQAQGKLDDAIARYTEALRLKPDYRGALSHLLFALNYADTLTPDSLFAEHARLGAQFDAMSSPGDMSIRHSDRGQRLRIGYVSPDFRKHSVAYFLEPLLRAHNKNAVEVFCYAEVLRPDVVTERFKSLADGWLSTVGMSAENLSRRIREDGIDILVDLAGHTGGNRLSVFTCKSAPVQVTWLGYPNTTGLRSIDYRLVDAVTDPEGEADALAVETLVRLTDGFLCYGPPDEAPKPAPLPCANGAAITFGSFNNPAKLSAMTLDAWAAILRQLPNARLLLKPFADQVTRELFLDRFAQRGIATKRIELMAWVPDITSHLSAYQQIDISLDPFPYNGATTTCEALWMGVPVVTLSGDRHAGRVGASILRRLNLDELVARDAKEYVQIAVNLADQRDRLADLRRSLRPRMAASPLCDPPAFARYIEAAYRRMWEIWCAGKPPMAFAVEPEPRLPPALQQRRPGSPPDRA
jgi:predicted O-linked N-acetylglucosamine transferase (SPINDLY family)